MHKQLRNYIYTFLGFFFLVVGIIGLFLPVLPTTPFLLLTAYFFSVSSPRFHNWLLNHRYFGPPIRDWEKNRMIRTRNKILATVMIFGSSVIVLNLDRIPLFGKIGYTITIAITLTYIWTRKGKATDDVPKP